LFYPSNQLPTSSPCYCDHFFSYHPATPANYTLSLHDALPISLTGQDATLRATRTLSVASGTFTLSGQAVTLRATRTLSVASGTLDRKSTRLNSSHRTISYAVFCLKKKIKTRSRHF